MMNTRSSFTRLMAILALTIAVAAGTVTVTYPAVKVGQTFMHKNLKYKVTSVKKKTVKCLGKYVNGKKVKVRKLKKPKKVKHYGRIFKVK